MGKEEERLTEEDRRALRGSKFAPFPSLPLPSRPNPRVAHPGGALATNKAAALAKFLERKLQQPGGLSSIDPNLLECAVKNAKDTLKASTSGSSNSGRIIRHVHSFGDSIEDSDKDGENQSKAEEIKSKKRKEKKNKTKKTKLSKESKHKRQKKKLKS